MNRKDDLVAATLALIFGAAGVMHFADPSPFKAIVPKALGNQGFWVTSSGVGELTLCVLLTTRPTRHIGGLMAIALLIAVFPANVYAAMQGGYDSFKPPFNSAAVAWARLPLQAVLIWWAWKIHRQQPVDLALQKNPST